MKKLALLATLLFSTLMFSSASFAEWTKVAVSAKSGDDFYVDFERIRKHGGYVYFWYLNDYLKPAKDRDLSAKVYNQLDCKLFRFKKLSGSFHKEPMGGGTGYSPPVPKEHKDWNYPLPDSVIEGILKSVCEYAK